MFTILHGRERRTSDDGKHDDDDVDDDDAEDKPTAARPTKRLFARPSRDRIETIGKRGGEIGRSNRYLERELEKEDANDEDFGTYATAIKENAKTIPEYQSKILRLVNDCER